LSKPTKEDAELLLRCFETMRSDEDFKKARWWFFDKFTEKNYRAFKKRYPRGSQGYRYFMDFVAYWELLSTLVLHGVLSEDLVFDMFPFQFLWMRAEPVVLGMREDMKTPRLFENFEVLGKKVVEWEKTHPPKV